MKHLYTAAKFLVFAVCSIFVTAIPVSGQEQSGKVKITETRIEIHPGAKISESDQKALDDVLKNYDKSLYKIETYTDGKLVKVKGKLSDLLIDKALASEVASAKAHGMTSSTAQLGNTYKTRYTPTPPASRAFTVEKERELVQAVKPILEKYTNK